MENKKIKLILIGAGQRGQAYTDAAARMSERFEVVAVAEPVEAQRAYVQKKHGIPDARAFPSWEPLLAAPKMADAALICTMDRAHTAPALAAMEKGYDLLLEKPAAPTPDECLRLEEAADAHGVRVLVCHVLRYTPFFRTLRRLIDEGAVGRVVSVQHREDVSPGHYSHAFVRGNWGNTARSTPMILQKSCHDMDILQWLLGRRCTEVQSFGSLSYFRPENAPDGAPERCLDGCPHAGECPYDARRLYLNNKTSWLRPYAAQKPNPSDEEVEAALRTTQYGRCVFRCDNDVVDHQVVNLLFDDGATVTFSMCGFTRGGRYLHIMGTRGVLDGHFGDASVTLTDFASGKTREIPVSDARTDDTIAGGHGGGDEGIMAAFHDLLCGVPNVSLCDFSTSVDNHMIAFAAEESRLSGRVISLSEYKSRIRAQNAV